MAYYDEQDEWGDAYAEVSYGCDPECGFETKSAAAMKRHESKCWWCQTPPDVIEAARMARAKAEAEAYDAAMWAEIEANAAEPCACICDPEYDYTCTGCEARAALAVRVASPVPAVPS